MYTYKNYPSDNRNTGYSPGKTFQSVVSQNVPRPKKSGASFTPISKGKSKGLTAVSAWIKTKSGLTKISAFGYQKTKGDKCEFEKAVAEIVNVGTGQMTKYPVLINTTTKRMVIKELGWIVTAAGFGVTSSGKNVRGAVVSIKK